MVTDHKCWEDHCRVIKFTNNNLSAIRYQAAEGWIDYKPGMSESAIIANQAIRKMMRNKQ